MAAKPKGKGKSSKTLRRIATGAEQLDENDRRMVLQFIERLQTGSAADDNDNNNNNDDNDNDNDNNNNNNDNNNNNNDNDNNNNNNNKEQSQ
jgi:hypothetical protein